MRGFDVSPWTLLSWGGLGGPGNEDMLCPRQDCKECQVESLGWHVSLAGSPPSGTVLGTGSPLCTTSCLMEQADEESGPYNSA